MSGLGGRVGARAKRRPLSLLSVPSRRSSGRMGLGGLPRPPRTDQNRVERPADILTPLREGTEDASRPRYREPMARPATAAESRARGVWSCLRDILTTLRRRRPPPRPRFREPWRGLPRPPRTDQNRVERPADILTPLREGTEDASRPRFREPMARPATAAESLARKVWSCLRDILTALRRRANPSPPSLTRTNGAACHESRARRVWSGLPCADPSRANRGQASIGRRWVGHRA